MTKTRENAWSARSKTRGSETRTDSESGAGGGRHEPSSRNFNWELTRRYASYLREGRTPSFSLSFVLRLSFLSAFVTTRRQRSDVLITIARRQLEYWGDEMFVGDVIRIADSVLPEEDEYMYRALYHTVQNNEDNILYR